MSDEGKSILERYVRERGVEFPVVSAPSAGARYRISGYPTFVLLDVDGRLAAPVTHGLPADQDIERELARVPPAIEWPGTRRLGRLRSAWRRGDLAAVHSELRHLEQAEDLQEAEARAVECVRRALEARLRAAARTLDRLRSGVSDYLRAREDLERLAREFRSLPPGIRAEEILARWARDAHVQRELKAARTLHRLLRRFDPSRISQRRKLLKALHAFERRHRGTRAAEQARARRVQLSR